MNDKERINLVRINIKEYLALRAKVRKYVARFFERSKRTQSVTIRQIAKRFGLKQKKVLEICEDEELIVNVGVGISGVGCCKHEHIGDYTIETN